MRLNLTYKSIFREEFDLGCTIHPWTLRYYCCGAIKWLNEGHCSSSWRITNRELQESRNTWKVASLWWIEAIDQVLNFQFISNVITNDLLLIIWRWFQNKWCTCWYLINLGAKCYAEFNFIKVISCNWC